LRCNARALRIAPACARGVPRVPLHWQCSAPPHTPHTPRASPTLAHPTPATHPPRHPGPAPHPPPSPSRSPPAMLLGNWLLGGYIHGRVLGSTVTARCTGRRASRLRLSGPGRSAPSPAAGAGPATGGVPPYTSPACRIHWYGRAAEFSSASRLRTSRLRRTLRRRSVRQDSAGPAPRLGALRSVPHGSTSRLALPHRVET
jgi:hypothetical protein